MKDAQCRDQTASRPRLCLSVVQGPRDVLLWRGGVRKGGELRSQLLVNVDCHNATDLVHADKRQITSVPGEEGSTDASIKVTVRIHQSPLELAAR